MNTNRVRATLSVADQEAVMAAIEVDDTVMQVGGEAYAAARAVYAAIKTPFAGPALRTAVDDLSRRFGRKRRAAAPAQPNAYDFGSGDTPAHPRPRNIIRISRSEPCFFAA